jgi:hypothetical protein
VRGRKEKEERGYLWDEAIMEYIEEQDDPQTSKSVEICSKTEFCILHLPDFSKHDVTHPRLGIFLQIRALLQYVSYHCLRRKQLSFLKPSKNTSRAMKITAIR